MNLKDKRKIEIERMKESKKEEVILAAVEVFKSLGIDHAKMTDVAKKAEIGVASLYRYFNTKVDLAIEAAIVVWAQEINQLYSRYEALSKGTEKGLDQVKIILEVFIELYENHPDFLIFIHEFDGFMVREKVEMEKLERYENGIIHLKQMLIDAIEKGKKDSSIKENIDVEAFYYTTTHALMSLVQKLLLRGHIIKSDASVSEKHQIETLIDMSVSYLKA